MEIINSVDEWKEIRKTIRLKEKSVGFVPTMGALHKGHESLIKKCVKENDLSVVSIFINPAQFNNPDDFLNYPKLFDKDLELLVRNDVNFLFNPGAPEIYPDNYTYRVIENSFSKLLCGEFRPGHFEGVMTVVMKLLNIIKPERAYFGEKDYQQFRLIQQMCKAFFMDVEIIPSPTIREKDGLAMSSRNLLLNVEERTTAPRFYELLASGNEISEIKNGLEQSGFRVEYITEIDGRRFGAVHLGKVRLIDNVRL